MRALAIRASDHHNALAQKFNHPPQLPILVILNFFYFLYEIDFILWLVQPSINPLELRTFCPTKVCLFPTHHSQITPFFSSYFNHICGTHLVVLPHIMGSFRVFFVLSLVNNFRNLEIISTFWPQSAYSIFKLTGRMESWESTGKQFARNSSSSKWQTV